MAPAFSKEAILTGAVDYFCLVCEDYFTCEREVCQHIGKLHHRENSLSINYVEMFRSDHIKKIKKWYFCELCNIILSTKTKVVLHVEEVKHKENKLSHMIERVGDTIKVFGNVTINTEAWHGIVENTCTLCNTEFDSMEIHMKEMNHVINLIQSSIREADGNIYRMVDTTSFHCLTCNAVVAEIRAHFNGIKHKHHVEKCREIKQKEKKINQEESKREKNNTSIEGYDVYPLTLPQADPMKIEKKDKDVSSGIVPHTKLNCYLKIDEYNKTVVIDPQKYEEEIKAKDVMEAPDILEYVNEFQNNNININFESNTAVCKRCSTSLDLRVEVIRQHIKEHENILQKKQVTQKTLQSFEGISDTKKDNKTLYTSPVYLKNRTNENTKTIETKAKDKVEKSSIKTVQENNDTSCSSNSSNDIDIVKNEQGALPIPVKNDSSQTSKNNEGTKKIKQEKKCDFKRVPLLKFIRHTAIVATSMELFVDCILNEQYCVDQLSFLLLIKCDEKCFCCQCCNLKVPAPDVRTHLISKNHITCMDKVLVVIYPGAEFIREIRPETFHCCFCNIVKDSWSAMEGHLKSTSHKECKTFSSWRLVQYKKELEGCGETQEQFHQNFFSNYFIHR